MTTFAILLLMPFALLLTNAVWETIATHPGGGSKVNFGNINCDGTCTFQSMQRKKNPNEVGFIHLTVHYSKYFKTGRLFRKFQSTKAF